MTRNDWGWGCFGARAPNLVCHFIKSVKDNVVNWLSATMKVMNLCVRLDTWRRTDAWMLSNFSQVWNGLLSFENGIGLKNWRKWMVSNPLEQDFLPETKLVIKRRFRFLRGRGDFYSSFFSVNCNTRFCQSDLVGNLGLFIFFPK